MIAAYIGSAAVGAGVYLMMRRKPRKTRFSISLSIFLVLCALFTVWFINTGGYYGIMGKNGIIPDWAN
ncbi:hypothetical protein CEV31_4161 [Brucella thiophenivorans]|uniref:Uncharacterized protein n=1 Tax=Brucella thiophenivorans TaxID=571255 RepID=A0A256EY26_9HYPH|nr:hypothetical protein CEV31_4161 [Brucella thiophenivorans]